MRYSDLFKKGSLKFVLNFVGKIVYDGFGVPYNETSRWVVLLISTTLVIFVLYKLVWLVWNAIKFVLSCWQW